MTAARTLTERYLTADEVAAMLRCHGSWRIYVEEEAERRRRRAMSDDEMVVVPIGQTVTIDLPAEEHWWVSSELMPDGSTRHERADGRVIVVRPAPTETIDGTAAEYPGTLTAEARAERAEAQLAALRTVCRAILPRLHEDEAVTLGSVLGDG